MKGQFPQTASVNEFLLHIERVLTWMDQFQVKQQKRTDEQLFSSVSHNKITLL